MKSKLAELYLKVRGEGIELRLSGVGNPNGEEGVFDISPLKIEIFVKQGRGFVEVDNAVSLANRSVDPTWEIVVLAHEFGHYLSLKNGKRSSLYDTAISEPIEKRNALRHTID